MHLQRFNWRGVPQLEPFLGYPNYLTSFPFEPRVYIGYSGNPLETNQNINHGLSAIRMCSKAKKSEREYRSSSNCTQSSKCKRGDTKIDPKLNEGIPHHVHHYSSNASALSLHPTGNFWWTIWKPPVNTKPIESAKKKENILDRFNHTCQSMYGQETWNSTRPIAEAQNLCSILVYKSILKYCTLQFPRNLHSYIYKKNGLAHIVKDFWG